MNTVPPLTVLQYLALIHQFSYAKVCNDVGVTPQQFTDWVKKRRPVPKERLDLLASYFHVEFTALIEEDFYLKDLTEERKIEVQIIFLRQKLEQPEEFPEKEGYQDKLEQLSRDQEKLHQISRFTAVYEQGSEYTRQLCREFLSRLEQGSETQLASILQTEEETNQ
ncbi:hypothetical protein [Paenibacillus pinihumi]|uniref:hypothetical protein n=1 Tax=Paenibacillus pinihumi TaxID=669462 RepID=UPI00041E796C|nr:hypothetical protein [Paenibacillus pinihumi]